jgi:hypothetical protein
MRERRLVGYRSAERCRLIVVSPEIQASHSPHPHNSNPPWSGNKMQRRLQSGTAMAPEIVTEAQPDQGDHGTVAANRALGKRNGGSGGNAAAIFCAFALQPPCRC